MKQLNKCPNCGAIITKMVGGIMRCEYCDSEFVSPYPPMIKIDFGTPEEQAKLFKAVRNSGIRMQSIPPNGLARDINGNLITQKYVRELNGGGT